MSADAGCAELLRVSRALPARHSDKPKGPPRRRTGGQAYSRKEIPSRTRRERMEIEREQNAAGDRRDNCKAPPGKSPSTAQYCCDRPKDDERRSIGKRRAVYHEDCGQEDNADNRINSLRSRARSHERAHGAAQYHG